MNSPEEISQVLRSRPADPGARAEAARERSAPRPALDAWALLDCLRQRWLWLVAGAGVLALTGGLAAWALCPISYTCTAQMIRYDPPVASEAFRPRALTTATLLGLVESTEVLKRMGAQLHPPQIPAQLARQLQVTLDRQSDITMVAASGRDPQATADLVNLYCREAIRYTQELQRQEAVEADSYANRQLDQLTADIAGLRTSAQEAILARLPPPPPPAPDELTRKIEAARDELSNLLLQYTDNHPVVRAQRSRLELLEQQQTEANRRRGTRAAAAAVPALPEVSLTPATSRSQDLDLLRAQLVTLNNSRALLIDRVRAIQQFKSSPAGYFQVSEPAVAREALVHRPGLKIAFFALFGGIVGLIAAAGQAVLVEFADNRLKTSADVRRVTGLPVLATLGNLEQLSSPDQDLWGFRTWTVLQNYLSPSPNHGIVCGFTSAEMGDGTTSWVRLMGRAASQCGFRVLTISARGANFSSNGKQPHKPAVVAAPPPPAPPKDSTALTTNVLAMPGQITEKLLGPNSEPTVHIPLPGWVWNLDRRKQWQTALESWSQIDNIVILVDLPPASVPEAVLLGQNVPNLIWLTESGRSDATQTVEQLTTLRHARCNFVGAVLNREASPPVKRRFTRWVGNASLLLLFSLLLAGRAPAAPASGPGPVRPSVSIEAAPDSPFNSDRSGPENSNAQISADHGDAAAPVIPADGTATGPDLIPAVASPEAAAGSFSVAASSHRAAWQRQLTLGPGDVLTFHLYSRPDLTEDEVAIGPDGRISYLEAENVQAAGLTVDQFRDRMNTELGRFRRSPQVYVYPVAYRSKKYFMLGTVVRKGVFTLDRPTTIIEAVARAQGLETGVSDRTLVELADFSRSFLARGGRHLPVDFEKLFLAGDLSQNVPLEPGDYLYFPANDTRQVYVLGAVLDPGAVNFNPTLGSISAIAMRGGFSTRAWKEHLLVVRGSLNHPQTFVVDASQVLAGEAPDFRLQPHDIVYVSTRPWIRVEEVLDLAASAFIESAVVTWTGVHAGPRFQ